MSTWYKKFWHMIHKRDWVPGKFYLILISMIYQSWNNLQISYRNCLTSLLCTIKRTRIKSTSLKSYTVRKNNCFWKSQTPNFLYNWFLKTKLSHQLHLLKITQLIVSKFKWKEKYFRHRIMKENQKIKSISKILEKKIFLKKTKLINEGLQGFLKKS